MSDDSPMPPDDAAPRVPATQVATLRTEFGVTVIGDPAEVDAYLDQFAVDTEGLRMSLPPARLQQAFGKGGLLASFGTNTVAKYMSSNDIVATPAESQTGRLAELRLVTRDPTSKRFATNTLLRPAEYALKGAAPELIAIESALQHLQRQLDEIQHDIAEVREDTQELLALANAQRLGDIYGHHRVLARHCAALDRGKHSPIPTGPRSPPWGRCSRSACSGCAHT